MEFSYKLAYYVMFAVSCLSAFILIKIGFDILWDGYGKNAEAIMAFIAALILGVGAYMAYNVIKTSDRYAYSCGVLGVAWILAFVIIISNYSGIKQ
ncbi:MAG: hypothetical protein IPL55_13295 [Saprospiraceae bacterium]|jgi:hypothetical protein|nr:hypothetical protein [Saprospiraceae bacterium]MBL0024367.1 hypothetical protein [Saprospiraceae bacterium]